MDSDGSDQRQLTPGDESALVVPGSFSPDGSTLAFTRREFSHADPGKADIYVVGLNGEGLHELVERATDPAYSPDGNLIAFATERDENGSFSYGHDSYFLAAELYVMNADGSDPERLTDTEGINEAAPAWSPNGARIAYLRGENISGDEEDAAVFGVNPDGSCPTPIASDLRRRVGANGRRVLVFKDHGAPAWRPGSEPGSLDC